VTGLVFAIFDSLLATSVNVESVGVVSVYVGVSSCSSVLESISANLSIVYFPDSSGAIDLHDMVAVSCVSGIVIRSPMSSFVFHLIVFAP
jgi:hypothetical protein